MNMGKSKYAGTQTEKNLEAAFAGESMARNKYTYFASKAKKEGFEQIAALSARAPAVRSNTPGTNHLRETASAPAAARKPAKTQMPI